MDPPRCRASMTVHQRWSSQSDSSISWRSRGALHRDEDLGGKARGRGSAGVQTGRRGCGSARLIKQRFPNLPIILLSAYSEIPERILWLLDESVMKGELPEPLPDRYPISR